VSEGIGADAASRTLVLSADQVVPVMNTVRAVKARGARRDDEGMAAHFVEE
jgi:hypothetical protein